MRYLQVVAQDRSAQGVGDFLLFRFYEDDRLLREATAAELRRLRVLGKTYLKSKSGDGVGETVFADRLVTPPL
ncbi:hypothetical protein [Pseudomonas prosekii]|uniref:hypothetical protein n=1 Tax=Pseudomonas prosekii TaxID=1148509 RepID=UPI00387B59E1